MFSPITDYPNLNYPKKYYLSMYSLNSEHVISEYGLPEHVFTEHCFSHSAFFEHVFSEHVFSEHVFSEHVFSEHVFSDIRIEDALFCAEVAIEHHQEFNLPLWMLSMDMRKAFDTIDHPALVRALRSRGLPEAYVSLLALLYANQMASVNGSSKFPIQRGANRETLPTQFYSIAFWTLHLMNGDDQLIEKAYILLREFRD